MGQPDVYKKATLLSINWCYWNFTIPG